MTLRRKAFIPIRLETRSPETGRVRPVSVVAAIDLFSGPIRRDYFFSGQ